MKPRIRGIFPEGKKDTADRPMGKMAAGDFVVLPLLQHQGVAAVPVVKPGDRVCKGQKIGEAADGLSCPVHASVSGTVIAVEERDTPRGTALCVVVENDYREQIHASVDPFQKPLSQTEPEELIAFLKEKGVVEADAAALPVWQKLWGAATKNEIVLIHCIDSEPYLTACGQLLAQKREEVIGGAQILLRASGGKHLLFVLDRNQREAAEELELALEKKHYAAVAQIRGTYPCEEESLCIRSVLGERFAKKRDGRVLVFSALTCRLVYRAFVSGMPAVDCAVTVSGDCVTSPETLFVPLGVSFRQVFQRCGGFFRRPDGILAGGPMAGIAQAHLDIPVTKQVRGVLAISYQKEQASACIRCGRCAMACPAELMPQALYRAIRRKKSGEALCFGLDRCIECGNCSYICPAKLPLCEEIRKGKISLFSAEKQG